MLLHGAGKDAGGAIRLQQLEHSRLPHKLGHQASCASPRHRTCSCIVCYRVSLRPRRVNVSSVMCVCVVRCSERGVMKSQQHLVLCTGSFDGSITLHSPLPCMPAAASSPRPRTHGQATPRHAHQAHLTSHTDSIHSYRDAQRSAVTTSPRVCTLSVLIRSCHCNHRSGASRSPASHPASALTHRLRRYA